MKEYTREEMTRVEKLIDNLVLKHDCFSIKEVCLDDEYALAYFIEKAMDDIRTIEHIQYVIKER